MYATRAILFTVIAAAVAAATIAPNAAAAQRHASPTGTDPACSAAQPCSITQAVSGAGAGDEVVVSPGDYTVTEYLLATKPITIHGVPGQPRPQLHFKGAAQYGLHLKNGGTLRYVEIDQTTHPRALVTYGVTVDQVIAKAPGSTSPAAEIDNGTIRNSIVVSSAPDGHAIVTDTNGGTNTTTYRNVTAIATGSGGVAIEAYAGFGGTSTIYAANVIARGGPGGYGFVARTDNSGAHATINAIHSNFANYWHAPPAANFVDGGGNQGDAPTFVDVATGDYRQASASVTIGTGVDDDQANGALDVDGDARRIGTTDIGADEFVPPQPTPPSPTPVPPPPTQPAQPFAGVELVSRKLTYARQVIRVRLRCPAGTVGRCSGRTTLTARPRRASARRITLARARFSIAPGNRARVRVRVTRAGRRLLNRAPRLRGRAVNAARDGASQSKTIRAAVTIRQRHR
jgi:hypothetical protein